jgi:hypothetical protein
MATLGAILAQADEVHAQSLQQCDAAFEESITWLKDTVAANQKTLAAQSCAAPLRAARAALGRARARRVER